MSEIDNKFNNFVRIVEKLRADKGCPWDKKQTADSLKRYLLEETQETIEAIDADNAVHIKEELGDLLYLIVLLAQISKEKDHFDIDDVIDAISAKMIRRHPHVFDDRLPGSDEELRKQWLSIKEKEKSAKDKSQKKLTNPYASCK